MTSLAISAHSALLYNLLEAEHVVGGTKRSRRELMNAASLKKRLRLGSSRLAALFAAELQTCFP